MTRWQAWNSTALIVAVLAVGLVWWSATPPKVDVVVARSPDDTIAAPEGISRISAAHAELSATRMADAAQRRDANPTFRADSARWRAAFDNGDLAAGMAWYRALTRCDMYVAALKALAENETDARLSGRSHEPRLRWSQEPEARYCGREAIGPEQRFELLLRLAQAGDLQSQLEFALNPPLQAARAVAEIELIERYRRLAPGILLAAFEQGSHIALHALLEAHVPPRVPALRMTRSGSMHSPKPAGEDPVAHLARFYHVRVMHHPPHHQIIQPDARSAYRYALLCEAVCNPHWKGQAQRAITELTPTLTPAERLAAKQDANRARMRYFATPDRSLPVRIGQWWGMY